MYAHVNEQIHVCNECFHAHESHWILQQNLIINFFIQFLYVKINFRAFTIL